MRIDHTDLEGITTIAYSGTLEENKAEALQILRERLDETLATRVFQSSLGFTIQNRRSGTKNDLQNIDSLIYIQTPFYRDAFNNYIFVTLDDLNTIKGEMIIDGLAIYQEKFTIETLIQESLTVEEVWINMD